MDGGGRVDKGVGDGACDNGIGSVGVDITARNADGARNSRSVSRNGSGMTPRVQRLKAALSVDPFPICTEKAQIVSESLTRNAGRPTIVMRAQAVADYLRKRTVRIMPDELIVGNVAAEHMGMEVSGFGPGWPDVDLNNLLNNGRVFLTHDGRNQDLAPYLRRGFVQGFEQQGQRSKLDAAPNVGWGLADMAKNLHLPDFAKIIATGYGAVIERAREELEGISYADAEAVQRADFYHACLIVFPAAIEHAHRFAAEADRQAAALEEQGATAAQEEQPQPTAPNTQPQPATFDAHTRAAELREIARICRKIPEHGAETFREALQAWYFHWLMGASVTAGAGRFDQYMYPYYKADVEAGRITRDEALELLEALRVKISELNVVVGDNQPLMAKWHNFVIGGCDESGEQSINDLTHMLVQAAFECRTPHPTLTLRVGRGTPRSLIVECLKVVRTGLGLPAFINEDSYIDYLTGMGVPLERARDFALAGCMDPALPGDSRTPADGVLLVPLVVLLALFNGCDPKTGERIGPATGLLMEHESFESLYEAFKLQFASVVGKAVEAYNILVQTQRESFPDVVRSALMDCGMELGRDYLQRPVLFENGVCINMVGMANAADALAAVKKLVFDERIADPEELLRALVEDWEDREPIRHQCCEAPKYGNNDAYVDEIAARLWGDVASITAGQRTIFGASAIATGISVSSNIHGGQNTSATPEGRPAWESFADGSISPEQGADANGPLAMLQSAMRIPQGAFAATLMNMKFSPSALAADEDLEKLASVIEVYFANGGRQMQFNVVSKKTLIEAKTQRNKYRDLIVRVAGYSAYYTTLTENIQDEVIKRSEQEF